MSYSFSVTASTKHEVKAKAKTEFDSIVANQPSHEKDRVYALASILSALEILADDDTKDIRVDCHGSLSWVNDAENITGVTLGVGAYHVTKAAQ